MTEHPTTPQWPTAEQVITALDALTRDPELTPGWRGVVARLRHDAETLAGVTAVRDLLAKRKHQLADAGPGPAYGLAVYNAVGAMNGRWVPAVYRYAYRAQAALAAVADGHPGPDNPLAGRLPGEHDQVPTGGLYGELVAPEPGLADALTGLDLPYIRMGLAQLTRVDQAHDEYDRAFGCDCEFPEESGSAHSSHHVPEHRIDQAAELEAEMDRWDQYLADYADTVAYTLTLDHGGLRRRLTLAA